MKVLLIFDKYCAGNDQLDTGIGDYVFIQTIQKIRNIQALPFYLYANDAQDPNNLTKRLRETIIDFSPNLIVITPHYVGKPIACVPERQVFRRLSQGIPSVLISYDTGNDEIIRVPNEDQELVSWINYWDGYTDIIVHTDCFYPVQEKFIGNHTLSHHICCFTPFDPDLGRYDPNSPRDIDYAFMGSVYQYRYPFVKTLQDLPYHGFIGDGPSTGRQLRYVEYLNVLKRSKISINFSKGWNGNSEQIKVRIWEILNCGSVLFEQDSQESRRILNDYDCAVFFESPVDLAQKVVYYLQHSHLLEEKRLASQAFLQKYSYENFWQIVLTTVTALGKPQPSAIHLDAKSQLRFTGWIERLTLPQTLPHCLTPVYSPTSLQALTGWVKQYCPNKIVQIGMGQGLPLRAWLAADPTIQVIVIDRDSAAIAAVGSDDDSIDRSRVDLRCQDGLVTDFSSLWSGRDRVLLYVGVNDRLGMPMMQYLLTTAIPTLPGGSVVVVDNLWYSPVPLSSQTLNKFWQARIVQDINLFDRHDMFAMPYWQGGSVVGTSGVLPLMAWVNTCQLDIYCYPGLKGIVVPVSNPVPTAHATPQPTAHLSYNPVGNFRIQETDQNYPNLRQVMALCQAGTQLYTIRQYQAALQQFQQAATLLPEVGNLYYSQALCWLQQGNFLAASQALKTELKFQPVSPEVKRLARKLAMLSPGLA